MLLGVLLAFASGGCFAQECDPQGLPDAVLIPEGETADVSLSKAALSTCERSLFFYQPWAGKPVFDTKGERVGTTGNLLLGDKAGFWVEVEVLNQVGGNFAVMVAKAGELPMRAGEALELDPDVSLWLKQGDGVLLNKDTAAAASYIALTEAKVGAIMAAWQHGFNPYPDRITVQFESDPERAVVHVGDLVLGPTVQMASVKQDALERIQLVLEGYSPCRFAEGDFEPPAMNAPAIFRCSLRP